MIEQYNEEVKKVNSNLRVLKRAGASYQTILAKINSTIEKLDEVAYYHNQQKTDLMKEKEKQDQFLGSLKKYLDDQNTKLKISNDSVDSFTNMSKLTLSSSNFKKLNKVKKDRSVEDLFRFLYVNLYNEKEEKFNFDDFKNVALDKDLNDFQKRISQFSVNKLDEKNRNLLTDIKNADYTLNKDNEDLCNLLAWLEYNFEAFLSLREKEQYSKTISETKNKEKKYITQSKCSTRILADLDEIIVYSESNLAHLKLYKKKIEEANDLFLKNAKHKEHHSKIQSIFRIVDHFGGNEVLMELDQEMEENEGNKF